MASTGMGTSPSPRGVDRRAARSQGAGVRGQVDGPWMRADEEDWDEPGDAGIVRVKETDGGPNVDVERQSHIERLRVVWCPEE